MDKTLLLGIIIFWANLTSLHLGYASARDGSSDRGLMAKNFFSHQDSSKTPLWVNGQAVAKDELLFFAQFSKTAVILHFQHGYQAQVDAGFWQRDFDGETPWERLMAQSISQVVRVKVLQQLCAEYEVRQPSNFAEFVDEWLAENERRKAMVARGEAVYGPIQLRLRDYFTHSFNQAGLDLMRAMQKAGRLDVSIEEALSHYNTNKAKYHFSNLQFERIEIPAQHRQCLTWSMDSLRQHPAVSVALDTLDHELKKVYSEEHEDWLASIIEPPLGSYSQPISEEGELLIFRPLAYFIDPDASFEQVATSVKLVLQKQKFQRLRRDLVASAQVSINEAALQEVYAAFDQSR